MENEIRIEDNNDVFINNTKIKEEIFDKQMYEYNVRPTEEEIDNLISWIGETTSENDKVLMKEDLKFLMSVEEKFVFTSISTNHFVTESSDTTTYDLICKEILELDTKLKSETKEND